MLSRYNTSVPCNSPIKPRITSTWVPGRKSLSIRCMGAERAGSNLTGMEDLLSPKERMFHESKMNCHIILAMGIGRKIDVARFRDGVESTILRHPRFSSIVVSEGGRNLFWVRTKVKAEDHLVIPDMDCNTINPDILVENYLSELSTTTMDSSRPLWDIHLLNIRTSLAEAVVILRVHHSIGDGSSLISLLLAISRKVSNPESLPTVPVVHRRGRHLRLWGSLVLLWNTVVDALLFVSTAVFWQDTETMLRGTEGVEFRRKRLVHRTVRLDDVKAIKVVMNCTINDVLLGVTSAGLSRYLSRKFAEDNGREKKDLSANLHIRAVLAVNTRQKPGLLTIHETMEKENAGARWGNFFSPSIIPLAICNYEDPLNYIRKGKAIAERKKNSFEAILTDEAAVWVSKLFGTKVATTLLHRVLSHTTLSFSNIYGPVEEIELFGHPLVYIAPSVYGHPHALTLHFQSYTNKLTMVATVDDLTISNPHDLLDDIVESLQLIKDAAIGKPIQE